MFARFERGRTCGSDTHDRCDPRERFARVPVRVSPRGSSEFRFGVDEHCHVLVAVFSGSVLIFFYEVARRLISPQATAWSPSRPVRVSRGSISTTVSERGSPEDPNRTPCYTKLAIVRQLNDFMRLTTTQHSTDDMPPCWMSTFSVHTHPREERPHARAAQIPDSHCSTWWKRTFMGNLESFFFIRLQERNSLISVNIICTF